MNKITGPGDCPHRKFTAGKYYCNHPETTIRYCDWRPKVFPTNCPLKLKNLKKNGK
jgi:hypothetical protein